MRHTREEVIARTNREFQLLDELVTNLKKEDWDTPLIRPETKDPWTVKDALAHITHWKADVTRKIRKQRVPPEERGLKIDDGNRLIYLRWHGRSPQEVIEWHRKVQEDLMTALQAAPDDWYSGKERNPQWPYDLDGHSYHHRVKDIERALKSESGRSPGL